MSQGVQYEPLTADGEVAQAGANAGDLRRLSAVPVDLSVEIGRARMSVGETLELREGSVVTLDRLAGEPVDLLVNGTPIARGEVVVIDEQFGLRLTQVLSADGFGERVERTEPTIEPTPEPELEAAEPIA
ncbi:MAG: flagellar motor switch protein FliN [Solirubrobacteraceae bacterium]